MKPTLTTAKTLIELAFACLPSDDDPTEESSACGLLLAVAHNILAHIADGSAITPESAEVLRRMDAVEKGTMQ